MLWSFFRTDRFEEKTKEGDEAQYAIAATTKSEISLGILSRWKRI